MPDTQEELEALEELENSELTDEEREARAELEVDLDETSQEFVEWIIDKLMAVAEEISGHPWYNYQIPFARRIFESLIISDGATLSALFARQTGKSETVANVIATAMIMFPRLAKIYPDWFEKYREGVWVGAFAPVDEQADTLFGRIVSRLTSDTAEALLRDPEINDEVAGLGRTKFLKRCGSLVRKTTAHPRATIEGRTYHVILIDECFPAGTPVLTEDGWTNIEEIAGNPDKNWIVATQGADGQVNWAPVKSSYKTRRQNELVRVVHEHGTMYATANHPFMVGGKTVPASMLRKGTSLSLVQGAAESSRSDAEAMPSINSGSMQQFSSGTSPERYAGPGSPAENGQHSEGNRTSPYSPWGEWDGPYTAPEDPVEYARAGMAPRACRVNWCKDQGRSSDALQNRPGESGADDSRGDRRRITWDDSPAGSRPAQDCVVVESRVVSVEILEPGSPEFDQFSDGADYVYTLEVDHPSHTYVAAGVFVGNCQGADDRVVNKSIGPMGAANNATMVFTGTPTYTANVFYDTIQHNRRESVKRGRKRVNHFEVDWKVSARERPLYKKFVQKEMLRMGEDSDEFKLSYRLMWLLDKGMFTTNEKLDACGDPSMQKCVDAWTATPVVVGIDPARIMDKTIVTVVWVDWDQQDDMGFYNHRVLNWLDLEGMDWEEQYYRIVEFLSYYNVYKIGVDAGGVGDAVIGRLKVLMPRAEIVPLGSAGSEQSTRWKYLRQLIDRQCVSWPAGAKVKRTKKWRRFRQEMEDLQVVFKGPTMLAEAPKTKDAHDDYCVQSDMYIMVD
jgi:hypothetical protein